MRTLFLVSSIVFGWGCGGSGAVDNPDAGKADGATDDVVVIDTSIPLQDSAPDAPPPFQSAVLLFAGDGPQFFDDTWEWNGVQWVKRNVAGPAARYDHALAALGGKIVLFGGEGKAGALGDTWEWDGMTWTQKMVAGPPARSRHRMATVGNKVVLFGGEPDSGPDFCDTWEWDGQSWTNKNATLATGFHCVGHAIAALTGTLYLFGGVGAFSDTWAYDGSAWNKVSSVGPDGRAFASMATLGDKIVLFGGEVNANDIRNDTWEWDGKTWTQRMVTGPSPRWHYGFTPFESKLVLFGGDGMGWLGDTWEWNGTSWMQRNVPGPNARYTYTLAAR